MPVSIAALPESKASVCVFPPLFASAPSLGSAEVMVAPQVEFGYWVVMKR